MAEQCPPRLSDAFKEGVNSTATVQFDVADDPFGPVDVQYLPEVFAMANIYFV